MIPLPGRRSGKGRIGIRFLLIALLLPIVVALLVLDSLNDYDTLTRTADAAYDRALLEAARLLEGSLQLDPDGRLRLDPPYVRHLVRSEAELHRHFRIATIDPSASGDAAAGPGPRGRTLAGADDAPMPPTLPGPGGVPVFFNAVYRDGPVRVVAMLRELQAEGQVRRALVVVAESAAWRQEAESDVRHQEMLRDLRTLAVEVLLVWLVVHWALRSLDRLRRGIQARRADDFTPLDVSSVPAEVVPLVEAINQHIERRRLMLDERAQFLADASHQLRTPLAIISTQAQYALREPDPAQAREGLRAIIDQLGRSRRLTEQLLSLAHASQGEDVPREVLDLAEVARAVVMQYLPLAHEKGQDLGWVDAREPARGEAAPVWGSEVELHEALSNLVHNAIRYAPHGARITVSIAVGPQDRYEVAVVDNGPGIAPSLHDRAFARFERVGVKDSGEGTGLGLSIARAYARRNAGDIELRSGEPNEAGGHGLAAVLWVPRSNAQAGDAKA